MRNQNLRWNSLLTNWLKVVIQFPKASWYHDISFTVKAVRVVLETLASEQRFAWIFWQHNTSNMFYWHSVYSNLKICREKVYYFRKNMNASLMVCYHSSLMIYILLASVIQSILPLRATTSSLQFSNDWPP